MVNTYRGEAPLVIDGVTYILRSNFQAMAEAEFTLGCNGLEELHRRISNMGYQEVAALLPPMARAGGNPIPEEVLASIDFTDVLAIVEPITDAMAAAALAKKKSRDAAGPPAKIAVKKRPRKKRAKRKKPSRT